MMKSVKRFMSALSVLFFATSVLAQDRTQQGRAILDQIIAELEVLETKVLAAEHTSVPSGSQREAQAKLASLQGQLIQFEMRLADARSETEDVYQKIAVVVSQAAVLAPDPAPEPEQKLAVATSALTQDRAQQGRAILDQIIAELEVLQTQVLAAEQNPAPGGSQREAQAKLASLQGQLIQFEKRLADTRSETEEVYQKIAVVVSQFAVLAPDLSPEPEQKLAVVQQPLPELCCDPAQDDPVGSAFPMSEPSGVDRFKLDRETPLIVGGMPQRVLVLPNAAVVENPVDPETRRVEIPVFSILYVYGEETLNNTTWLAVGETETHQDGWILEQKTESWRSMLVMRYARKSDRDRVLFFADPEPIHDIIEDFFFGHQKVDNIHASVADGTYDPSDIIAIEPKGVVDDSQQVYLMPILDYQAGEFDDGTPTQILQLAGLNLNSDSRNEALPPTPIQASDRTNTEYLEDLRLGLAFVIDTTTSMGPYIDQAQNFVSQVETRLRTSGIANRFDIALLGYRDSLQPNSGIDYRTEIFRDFGEKSSNTASEEARRMVPSQVSTKDWREDAFAGLTDAINELDWNAVDGRIVFLVTDASPRTVDDSLARDPAMGPATIAQMAAASDVTMFIMHMVSDYARDVSLQTEGIDDTAVGRRIYRQVKALGGDRVGYFQLFGDSAESFGRGLSQTADAIIPTLVDAAHGVGITSEQLDNDAGIDQSEIDQSEIDSDILLLTFDNEDIEIRDESDSEAIASAVLSELFRQQQEFLGARNATEAPEFYRAWAADRDLSRSSRRALDVSVMLSRAQLSDLTTRLEDLIEAMQNKKKGMGDFFAEVQDRSGHTLVDPNLGGSVSDILPQYLNDLPYVSKLLRMSAEEWDSLPPQTQKEFVDDVRAKVRGYREVAESQRNWYRLTDRDGGENVYPLPLAMLP